MSEVTEDSLMVSGGRSRSIASRRELTVKEYAHRERVHERTVRRWIEKDAVTYRRTPGGQYRIDAGAS